MFLASRSEAPFSSMMSALVDDAWTLLFARSDELFLELAFDRRDPVVAEAYRKYTSPEYTSKQGVTMRETLIQLRNIPQSVMFGSRGRVANQLASMDADHHLDISMFCEPRHYTFALMLRKNSPFRKILNAGILKLIERGEMMQLVRKWFRDVALGHRHLKAYGITLEQLNLALLLFIPVYAVASIILLLECSLHYFGQKAD